MDPAARHAARQAIVRGVLLACPAQGPVAGYLPLATEPGSQELLLMLHTGGHEVLVPITRPDRDLDWCTWQPPATPGDEPQLGPPLGLDAVAAAALVLVPAFAVDHAGRRLGRGGGSYDRALRRVGAQTTTAALLFSGELIPEVPAESWDIAVRAVVTPDGFLATPLRPRNI